MTDYHDHDDHDETDSPPACCKSCGVPFVEHAGLQGCCAKLQALLAASKKALAELSHIVNIVGKKGGLYEEARDELKAAIARVES